MEILSSTDWAYPIKTNSFRPNAFIEISHSDLGKKIKALWLLLIASPLLGDAFLLLLRRLIIGQAIFQPHRLHLFQRLHQGWLGGFQSCYFIYDWDSNSLNKPYSGWNNNSNYCNID